MQAVLLATVVATGLLQSLAHFIDIFRYSSFKRLQYLLTKLRNKNSTACATSNLFSAEKHDAKALHTAAALDPDNPHVDSEFGSRAQGSKDSASGRHCLDKNSSE